jgi:hypothetical protein
MCRPHAGIRTLPGLPRRPARRGPRWAVRAHLRAAGVPRGVHGAVERGGGRSPRSCRSRCSRAGTMPWPACQRPSALLEAHLQPAAAPRARCSPGACAESTDAGNRPGSPPARRRPGRDAAGRRAAGRPPPTEAGPVALARRKPRSVRHRPRRAAHAPASGPPVQLGRPRGETAVLVRWDHRLPLRVSPLLGVGPAATHRRDRSGGTACGHADLETGCSARSRRRRRASSPNGALAAGHYDVSAVSDARRRCQGFSARTTVSTWARRNRPPPLIASAFVEVMRGSSRAPPGS